MNFSTPLTNYEITGNLDGWDLSFSQTSPEENLEIVTWKLKSESPRTLPALKLKFLTPQKDSQVKWHSKSTMATLAESHHYLQWWWNGGRNHSGLVRSVPVYSFMNLEGINCMTFALSDAHRDTFCSTGPQEGRYISAEAELFTVEEAPLTETEFSLRLDRRPLFYADVLRQVSDWYAAMPAYTPAPVPQSARMPLYSTWYQYQKDVSAEKLERELDRIAESGMKTVILDDGWQCEMTQGGGAVMTTCGEWQPFDGKFPDMAGHVRKFHDKGIRYMMWFAVPYVGCKAKEVFNRFEGKCLNPEADETRILDPRYPDVREYLIQTYERAVRQWDLDGLKLDFIDQFSLCGRKDPAAENNYAGCDIKSLPDAVDRLLSDTMSRLKKLKPNILIEFRQVYIGPAIRKYGNMFRACDCAHDLLQNRVRVTDIRLLAGDTAVHADMTIWSPEDTAEVAALQILNVLFSVPQVSVLLEKLSDRHWAMVKFWMTFFVDHMETLQHGKFVPLHPELSYPVVTAHGNNESITALYTNGFAVPVEPGKPHLIVNAKHGSDVILDLKTPAASVRTFDVVGNEVESVCPDGAGLVKLQVPPSGYVEVVTSTSY